MPADSQVATPSATVTPTNPLPAPPSPIPTDDSPVASASAEVSTKTEAGEVSQAPVPADSGNQPSTGSIPTSPISPQEVTPVIPESPEATGGSTIKDSLPSDQPSHVQPVSPEPIPSVEATQVPVTASQSAEIKPEPLQDIQNAPSADLPSEASAKLGSSSPKSSFGEIMYGSGKPDSLPVVPQPTASSTPAKTTFGDLNPSITPVEPTINIEPVKPPKAEPSPISPSLPLSPPSVSPSASLHQKATQVRQQKRGEHLAKILTLIQQKGKVKNEDIRDFLHVSQTTATDYLHTLVQSGKIKKSGKAKATVYSL